MKVVGRLLLIFIGIISLARLVTAQSLPLQPLIEPREVLLPVGVPQPFQLLQVDGNDGGPTDWSISDPTIADLTVVGKHAIVTAKTAGQVTLSNSSGAQAEIYVHDGSDPTLPLESRWILQPLDGQFVRVLWASGTWGGSIENADERNEGTAAYYYEDRGREGSHVRAIREDGVQVWQWPESSSKDSLKMICGDVFGGVLIQVGEQQSRILVNLDASGHERWRFPAPGFSGKDFTYTLSGMLYFLEEHPNNIGGRVIGLDAHDGSQKFAFELPTSHETLHGLSDRNGGLVCSPGAETLISLPSQHSRMLSNIMLDANFAYSEFELDASTGECTAGSTLPVNQIHLSVRQRLVILDVHKDGTFSTGIIEENKEEGIAGDTWVQASVPTGDIIPGDQGTGNFIAVRRTKQLWRGKGPGIIEEFEYSVGDDRSIKFKVPVPVSPINTPSDMLLGENSTGYTTRGKTVIAFDTVNGKEIWRWESKTSAVVLACAALVGDEVLIHEGDGYTILRDGNAVDQRAEAYMLFVAKLRFDWDNF